MHVHLCIYDHTFFYVIYTHWCKNTSCVYLKSPCATNPNLPVCLSRSFTLFLFPNQPSQSRVFNSINNYRILFTLHIWLFFFLDIYIYIYNPYKSLFYFSFLALLPFIIVLLGLILFLISFIYISNLFYFDFALVVLYPNRA